MRGFRLLLALAFAAAALVASCGRNTPQTEEDNPPWQDAPNLGGDPAHGNVLRRALMHRYPIDN